MPERLLIVRGVRTTDQLQALGMPMAHRYEQADRVALIGEDNRGVLVKGATDPTIVELFDADSSAGRCAVAIRRVAEHSDDPGSVGMFLFYWPLYIGSAEVVIDGLERGDAVAVEAAADLFISTDCGANLPALSKISGDEQRSDASGHAVDGEAGALPETG